MPFDEIKTQPVFYRPLIFEQYEMIEYKTPLSRDKNMNEENYQIRNRFHQENRSDYISGKGKFISALPLKSGVSIDSYEWFLETHNRIHDTKVLQDVLSLGRKTLNADGWREDIPSAGNKKLALELCEKYGLIDNTLTSRRIEHGEKPPHPFGCNVWGLIFTLQDLYIFFNEAQRRKDGNDDHDAFESHFANISAQCLYSEKEKRFKTILVADTLLDLLLFQLQSVIADGVYARKCANPTCSRIIIGGRSDKKTCSGSCRQALRRYDENGGKNRGHY